jgi:hypothetical protein
MAIYLAVRKELCANAKYQEIPSYFICIGRFLLAGQIALHPIVDRKNLSNDI